jgi:predicted phage gp36 major capsid-like protein
MTFIASMTRAEAVARMQEIHDEMEPLGDKPRLNARDDARFLELDREFDDLSEHVGRLDRAAELASASRTGGRFRTERGSIGEDDTGRDRDGVRGQALRCLDDAVRDKRLPARAAETVEALMSSGPAFAQTWVQRYTAAAGDPSYERAFGKLISDPQRGHLLWTEAESAAFRTVSELQTEQRAMSTTDSAGGYLAPPLTLDPSILLTSNGL